MKQERIRKFSILSFLTSPMALGNQEHREDVFNDKVVNNEIDTCCPSDTGVWETGIRRGTESWVIVTQYHSRSMAEVGHKEWVEALTKTPALKLKSIQ